MLLWVMDQFETKERERKKQEERFIVKDLVAESATSISQACY